MNDYQKQALTKITLNDLNENHKLIAECIGLEAYIKLSTCIGGTATYIPTVKELLKTYTQKEILKMKGILTPKQAAAIYGISESSVYKIFKKGL